MHLDKEFASLYSIFEVVCLGLMGAYDAANDMRLALPEKWRGRQMAAKLYGLLQWAE
jgi:hypothetical protein